MSHLLTKYKSGELRCPATALIIFEMSVNKNEEEKCDLFDAVY